MESHLTMQAATSVPSAKTSITLKLTLHYSRSQIFVISIIMSKRIYTEQPPRMHYHILLFSFLQAPSNTTLTRNLEELWALPMENSVAASQIVEPIHMAGGAGWPFKAPRNVWPLSASTKSDLTQTISGPRKGAKHFDYSYILWVFLMEKHSPLKSHFSRIWQPW